MSRTSESADRPASLPLEELFTRYLGRQAEAAALGLGHVEAAGDVEPYEAVPVQPVEPRVAWSDAVAAAGFLADETVDWPVPPEWPVLVAGQDPAVAVAFAIGNFPQLVRDLQSLIAGEESMARSKDVAPPVAAAGLVAWAERQQRYPNLLLAAGALRLARQFDLARDLLDRTENLPEAWQAARANEVAALAWQSGKQAEALALWQAQGDSVPVYFNRGMALLFLGRPGEAKEPLARAIAGLKETTAWHHLAQLYRTLANARG